MDITLQGSTHRSIQQVVRALFRPVTNCETLSSTFSNRHKLYSLSLPNMFGILNSYLSSDALIKTYPKRVYFLLLLFNTIETTGVTGLRGDAVAVLIV